jgi:hypothetical protein
MAKNAGQLIDAARAGGSTCLITRSPRRQSCTMWPTSPCPEPKGSNER